MFLAEALLRKVVLKKELEALERRMGESSRVPYDEEPVDDYLGALDKSILRKMPSSETG